MLCALFPFALFLPLSLYTAPLHHPQQTHIKDSRSNPIYNQHTSHTPHSHTPTHTPLPAMPKEKSEKAKKPQKRSKSNENCLSSSPPFTFLFTRLATLNPPIRHHHSHPHRFFLISFYNIEDLLFSLSHVVSLKF